MNPPSRGTAEVSQDATETRAQEIAQAAGREQFNADDLSQARDEVLGKSSPNTAAPPNGDA